MFYVHVFNVMLQQTLPPSFLQINTYKTLQETKEFFPKKLGVPKAQNEFHLWVVKPTTQNKQLNGP